MKAPAMVRDKQSKKQLISKLLPLFRAYGYDGVTLNALAAAAGLSKPSLYHHFPGGKEAMARYGLAVSGAQMQALIMAPLMDKKLTPETAVEQSLDGVRGYYSGDAPRCLMNSMTLGAGGDLFGADIERAMTGWQQALTAVLIRGGAKGGIADNSAAETIALIQGSLILASLRGSRDFLDQTVTDRRAVLLSLVAS